MAHPARQSRIRAARAYPPNTSPNASRNRTARRKGRRLGPRPGPVGFQRSPAYSQSSPPHHGDRGSFCEKSGLRFTLEYRRELSSVQLFRIALKCRSPNLPDSPRRMRHAVFHATTSGLSRISPVMLGDELFNRALSWQFRIAIGFKIHLVPEVSAPPSVRYPQTIIASRVNLMRHWESHIILFVERAGNQCNCPARNQLPDKHYTSPDFVPYLPSHVKAQVHFLEIRVHRNWQEPEQFCLKKSKSDEAGKDLSLPEIELGSRGDEVKKHGGVHLVIQHGQVLPFCRAEDSVNAHVVRIVGPGGPIHPKIHTAVCSMNWKWITDT